ncbi:hypothetical protein F5146DRAFT_426011 [Armillaria mellea]|nr:hypothetical protein F5146DRAFT_426011 [Armillaria mellea]
MRLNYRFFFVALTLFCLYATSTHANDEGTTLAGFLNRHQITTDSTEYQELYEQAVSKVMIGARIQLQMAKRLYHGFTCGSFLFRIDESTLKISSVTILAPTMDAQDMNQRDINKNVKGTKALVKILLSRCTS